MSQIVHRQVDPMTSLRKKNLPNYCPTLCAAPEHWYCFEIGHGHRHISNIDIAVDVLGYLAMPGAQPADHIAWILFLLRDAYADEYRKRDVK